MVEKRYYRCNVCNDVHYGNNGPRVCPTCGVKNGYSEVDENEAAFALNFKKSGKDADIDPDGNRFHSNTDSDKIIALWKRFTLDNDFMLNTDEKHVMMVADGVLTNEEQHGLKLCPCRLRDQEGSRKRDLELLCPCNFKLQETWTSRNDCWCGLFVKRV